MDLQRRERLDDLEARINAAAAQAHLGIVVVADCIEAAELARSLDLPRTDVDGRFQRAQRIAREHGSQQQQVNAAYQWAWATYWWFEDYRELVTQYGEVEKLAKGSLNAYDLELLSNLWLCLCGAVRFEKLSKAAAKLDERYGVLIAELEHLAKQQDRPSTALQAKALALTIRLMYGLPEVDGILNEFEKLIRNCKGLVGLPHTLAWHEVDAAVRGALAREGYSPSAVFFTPRGPLRGTDAIRPLFQAMIAEFAKPGAAFNMKQQFVDGDYGYIVWTAETADNVYELGTDTFIVRDGRIVAQSFTGKITPKN